MRRHQQDVGRVSRIPVAQEVKAREGAGADQAGIEQAVLDVIKGILPALGYALGPDTEVVLHDLRRQPESIIAVGGSLTGRHPGSPGTDLVLRHLRQGETEHNPRYRTRAEDGRVFRSSALFLRDHSGTPFGCLCLNVDLTEWQRAEDLQHRALLPADNSWPRRTNG